MADWNTTELYRAALELFNNYNPAKHLYLMQQLGNTSIDVYKRQHEGSIGNLCNDRIESLMRQVVDGFNFSVMEQAERCV